MVLICELEELKQPQKQENEVAVLAVTWSTLQGGGGHEAEIKELGLQHLVEVDEQEDRRVGERDMCRGCGGLRLGIVLQREEEALGRVVSEKLTLYLQDIDVTNIEIDLREELSKPVHHRIKVLLLFDSIQARPPRG